MSEPREEPVVLILGDVCDPAGVRGAVCVTGNCGHPGWASPSSQRHLAAHPETEALCMACGEARVLADPEAEFGIMPGQPEEAAAALARMGNGVKADD